MSQYKAYPAHKDSGVEWIGQVPEHWKIAPVKYHYDARLGKMIQPAAVSDRDIEVPYHRAQTVQWERIVESDIKEMWASPRDIEQFSVSEGDLLICEGGDVCRAAIVKQPPEKNMIFQNSIHRIRSKGEYGVGWVMRLMQHLRSSEWIDVLCNKNTIVHFTSDKLGSLECPLPPPDEQASIAATLDRETARIDALIQKKTRFIDLLKEKRQALITHAVTKGLDPNVKMKDSGIEWIGQVPEHWEVKPICRVTSVNDDALSDSTTGSTRISYVDISSVGYTEGIKQATEMAFEDAPSRARRKASTGDVVVSTVRTYLKAVAAVTDEYADCIFSTGFAVLRARQLEQSFLKWMILNELLIQSIEAHSEGLSYPAINASALVKLKSVIPPPEEQATIAAALERETARIDALIGKAEQSITLLKERRSAFITAAVTGQIDLRGEQ
ncbi:MAG: hypothetical protein B7X44_10830 [Halothiobacillus sp. 15-55-196]|jgi:type I restriction enzyme S subunit|uniref:restriction endonuclease subunit S n=1 Tax=Halothiobacillus sp. 15-55-196 TaxID=1970382 RepID=UPI000BCB642B|nr:restriction endonuclease subunit S [Halothiobacillus sp. 15-55-196]OZB35111.1 MAG: hypothetical protein B7X44_10830 [Halothiobacillus sp. 15-55-196]